MFVLALTSYHFWGYFSFLSVTYLLYLNKTMRKTGGIFMADDTLSPAMELDPKWNDQVEPINEFNRLIAATSDFESTLLPIGDGMVVAVKK
jgi:predicted O-methyltransferase YrrM